LPKSVKLSVAIRSFSARSPTRTVLYFGIWYVPCQRV
jgi:hypothetical protein